VHWFGGWNRVCGIRIEAAARGSLRSQQPRFGNLDLASYVAGIGMLAVLVSLSLLIPAARVLRLNLAKILHYD
jgi:hypothetical protein